MPRLVGTTAGRGSAVPGRLRGSPLIARGEGRNGWLLARDARVVQEGSSVARSPDWRRRFSTARSRSVGAIARADAALAIPMATNEQLWLNGQRVVAAVAEQVV